MGGNTVLAWCSYAFCIPFLMVGMILVHYGLARARWRWKKRRGFSGLGFYPSAFALSLAFQFISTFHRPSIEYVIEARLVEDADEDGNGDPDSPQARLRHFHRQLLRIRRGDPVDRLQWRL